MDDATQPSTQPHRALGCDGLNNSGLVEKDVADIICILHPSSMGAHSAVTTTARHGAQHLLETDQLVYEPTGPLSNVSSSDVALRFSSKVKDPGLGFCFGRNKDRCDIVLTPNDTEKKISNMHFRIYLNTEGILMFEDTSTNGTIVDDKIIHKARKNGAPTTQMLVPGSIIHVLASGFSAGVKFIVRIPSRDGYEGEYTRNLVQYLGRIRQANRRTEVQLDSPFIRPQQMSHTYGMHWNGGSKYNVTGQVGKGAFATVYKLATKNDGSVYACKELDKRRLMKNNVLDHKVDSEMRIMRGLEHPNIVQFHDHFDHDNRWIYIIMEYIGGGELSSYLTQVGQLKEEMVQNIARQVLHALQYLHRRKITHRDIKPDNILISSFDPLCVKLSDFGLSKVVQEETFLKTFCGTLLYCAPEVYPEYENYRRGEARKRRRAGDPLPKTSPYDQSVDMWSFGAVLFHILCGHPPYLGRGDDRGAQMLRNIMTTQADYSLLRNAGVSEQGIDFVSTLLNRDPKSRPKEAECFRHPWIANVPDEFDYTELDGPLIENVSSELVVVEEADEEEELDASVLEINDGEFDDEDFDYQEGEDIPSSEPVNVKRPRVGEEHDGSDQQVVMVQRPVADVHYPSLPNIASYTSGVDQSRRPLFGEIPESALRGSAAGEEVHVDEESMNLPEFLEPQQRDPSFSDLSSSFGQASGFALSLDTAGQTHQNLLSARPSNFGLGDSSLEGAESLVGHLNMESSTSNPPPPSTDPNSDNPTTPEPEANGASGSTGRRPSTTPVRKAGSGSSQQETPNVREFNRRINTGNPSLSSVRALKQNVGENEDGTSNGHLHQGSANDQGAKGRIPDELAQTIDEKTGKEIGSFPHPNQTPLSPPSQPFGKELSSTPKADNNGVGLPTLLGQLIPVTGSIPAHPIRIESRMTSWGRGTNATVRHVDEMDPRIPMYAIELTFWAPAIESRIATGQDWREIPDVVTIISTKARKSIWVNDERLQSETPGKDAYLFGKIYTGDTITVYRDREQSLQFKCEFYHGQSMKRRSETGEPKFVIEKAKKTRAAGSEMGSNSKMTNPSGTATAAPSLMGPSLPRTQSDLAKKLSVENKQAQKAT